MQALVIHNTSAGKQDLSRETLLEAVHRAGADAVSYQEKHQLDLTRADEADLVVIAGGDGTLATVISNLPQGQRLISIVPSGTANNIAMSLGLADRAMALGAIGGTARRQLDIACASWADHSCVFIEGLGFGSLVSMLEAGNGAVGREKIAKGREALGRAVMAAKPLENLIVLDGRALEGEWLFAEFLNVAISGPNLPLAPGSNAGDGAFELVLLSPERREAFCAWLTAPEAEPPPVERMQVVAAEIRGECNFRIDDERCRLGPGETLRIGITGQIEVTCND